MSTPSERAQPMGKGVWLFPSAPAGALVDAIVAADDLGLDEVWVADEGVGREPVAVLSAAAGRTQRIRLAVGVTSPVLRHPGAIASSLATLDELSSGRAVLGLGIGGSMALEPFGLRARHPVALLRNAIETARAVFDDKASDGYEPPAHSMPPRPVPIWVGARGPQLVRTATRHADGLFLSGCTPQQHDSIAANAATAGGTALALYQSAFDRPTKSSEQTWDDAHGVLTSEAARLRPTSIGINLVGLIHDDHPDPVEMVTRAAELLAGM